MVVWSKALPLTACCLSPLPGFRNPTEACEKVVIDLGLGSIFCQVLQFPTLPTTGYSQLGHNMTVKVMKTKILKLYVNILYIKYNRVWPEWF